MICPVRVRTPEQDEYLQDYVRRLESCDGGEGVECYFPGRDTAIAEESANVTAITALNQHHMDIASEVHVFYDPTSSGSVFDLGMAWAMGKPIRLVNEREVYQMAAAGAAWALLLAERMRASERLKCNLDDLRELLP